MPEIKVSICRNGVDLGEWKITEPEAAPLRSAQNLVNALQNVSEFHGMFVAMGRDIKVEVEPPPTTAA
jgi:hypothetical protein